MAKKTRKPNLPQETLERARREMERTHGGSEPIIVEALAADAPPAGAKSSPARRPMPTGRVAAGSITATPQELRAQYYYVINDLRNMAALATILLIGLVVLSFFI